MDRNSSTSNSNPRKEFKLAVRFLTTFSILFLLLDWSIGAGLSYSLRNSLQENASSKLNFFTVKESSRTDLVVMGSSRAHYHVRPELVAPRAYNLGVSGMGLSYHLGAMAFLTDKSALPSKVLLHLDIPDLAFQTDSIRQLSPYLAQSPGLKALMTKMGVLDATYSVSRSRKFNSRALGILTSFSKTILKGSSKSQHLGVKLHPKMEPNLKRLNYHADQIEDSRSLIKIVPTAAPQLLAHLEAFSQERQLILFTSPNFRRFETPGLTQPLEAALREFCSQNDVIWLDYRNDEDFQGKSELWHDSTHLNALGAELFSKKLGIRVQEILEPET